MKKLVWEQISPLEVRALRTAKGRYDSVSSNDLYFVSDWCEERGIGYRVSFDTFKFKSSKEVFLFLLTWS
jgi:hypothetical protein